MNQTIFEEIKKVNEYGQEFWSARELSEILEYSRYRDFVSVVEKAKVACKESGFKAADHMEDILHMVAIGSGAARKISDIKMSRYACYLAVQNADSSKKIVALAQTYFAVQTRRQEAGKKVRKTIKDLGGTMPEQLPMVEHVKSAKKRLKIEGNDAGE